MSSTVLGTSLDWAGSSRLTKRHGWVRTLIQRIHFALPRGRELPLEVWDRRHRGLVLLLWAHAVGITCFAVLAGVGWAHSLEEGAVVAIVAVVAGISRFGRRLRSAIASLGLLSASGILVHLSGGYIELHFHFFVMVAVIALYQDWLPFLLAIGYVVAHHGVVGVMSPTAVYNHPAAWNNPWIWAGIHGAFITAQSAACIVAWRLNELSQAALRRAEGKYRAIFDDSIVGIFQMAPDGRYLMANAALARTLGYRSPAVLMSEAGDGQRLHVDPTRAQELLQRLATDGVAHEFEDEIRRPDGTTVWISQNIRAVRDAAGAVLCYEGTAQDVTERRGIQQMKSDFVSFATHQLRTPLSGIKWLLELVAHEPDVPAEARGLIADARESADRLTRLVNDMLNIARLEGRNLKVAFAPTSLPEVTDAVLSELQPLLQAKQLRLTVGRGDEVPRVQADAKLVAEVVTNLISNAITYTPAGGDIQIRMTREDDQLRWSVRDTGIGIPEAARPRIFERFYRAENALTASPEGTGLGLALARLIIEGHGGRVGFESVAGEGSTFFFTLPFVRGSA